MFFFDTKEINRQRARFISFISLLMSIACSGGHARSPNAFVPVTAPQGIAPSPGVSQPSPMTTAPAEAHATYVGRVWHLDPKQPDHVMLSWAGVAAGVHFFGTGISMQVSVGTATQQSWFDIVIDGNATSPLLVTADSNTVSLAAGLSSTEHTLWLTKRTEASFGVINLDHFSVAAGGNFLTPPVAPTRSIEVIGASMGVGFGDLGQDCNSYDAVNFEDETLAWGHATANLLGAAESNLSFSGYGLLASGSGPVAAGYTMQDFFTRTDPFLTHTPWDFQQHPVDAVLFDLGSNDYNYYNGVLPPTFTSAYVDFVQAALKAYPRAQIYIILSPTITSTARTVLDAAYRDVVQQLQTLAPGQVHYYPFAQATGDGCFDHPLPDLHAQMAAEIAAQIQRDLP